MIEYNLGDVSDDQGERFHQNIYGRTVSRKMGQKKVLNRTNLLSIPENKISEISCHNYHLLSIFES